MGRVATSSPLLSICRGAAVAVGVGEGPWEVGTTVAIAAAVGMGGKGFSGVAGASVVRVL